MLMCIAEKQSLSGIVFNAIEKLPEDQWPRQDVLFEWVATAEQIKGQNILTTNVCKKLCDKFEEDGFESCILKGQSNHAYYGEDLGNLRTCGDVDVWVVPKTKTAHPVKKVLDFLYGRNVVESLCWLHAEVRPIKDVPIEIHLRPSFFNTPIRNRLFLSMFDFEKCVCKKTIDGVELPVLKTDYDIVFQMNHLYRHLLDEGVGMRQVLDYYMLLQAWNKEGTTTKEEMMESVEKLGMTRFAHALMYVLQKVFSMDASLLLCTPSEQYGKFLLNEILEAGNFGHYDARMKQLEVRKGELSYQLQRTYRRIMRNLRFLTSYPSEVMWEPVARGSHFLWRKLGLWRF